MKIVRNIAITAIFAALTVSVVVAQDAFELNSHITVEDSATLSGPEAEKIYQRLRAGMIAGYRLSDDLTAKKYSSWERFNKAPYLSSQHGNRYVSNFGNKIAKGYLSLKENEKMPFGSILVKDSFTALPDGQFLSGALFIMEKLSEEAHPDTADWRYSMVLPDGSVFGDTTGENPRSMDFCHVCHIGAEDTDYLFLLPETD